MAHDRQRRKNRKIVSEDELSGFLRRYARKAPKRGEPNDRTYDRRLEDRIKRLSPEEFDELMNAPDSEFASTTEVGDVIEIVEIDDRGLAIMLNTRGEELIGDKTIEINSSLRIVAVNGESISTRVCGLELMPLVCLLLPSDLDPSLLHVGDRVFLS